MLYNAEGSQIYVMTEEMKKYFEKHARGHPVVRQYATAVLAAAAASAGGGAAASRQRKSAGSGG